MIGSIAKRAHEAADDFVQACQAILADLGQDRETATTTTEGVSMYPKMLSVRIDEGDAAATFSDNRTGRPVSLLDLCIIWQSAADEVQRQTGSDIVSFLDGMRELMAPVGG